MSLTNNLQPLSYQSTSNITPRLPLYTSQPTPKIYNATALLTHPLHTYKSSPPSTSTPKYTPPQHLVFINSCHSWKLLTAIYIHLGLLYVIHVYIYIYIFLNFYFNNQTRLPNIEINLKTPSIKVQSWTIISNQVLELNFSLGKLCWETDALFFNPLARFQCCFCAMTRWCIKTSLRDTKLYRTVFLNKALLKASWWRHYHSNIFAFSKTYFVYSRY